MSDMTANENSQIFEDIHYAANYDPRLKKFFTMYYDPRLKKFVKKDIDPLEIVVPFERKDTVYFSGGL